MYVMVQWLVPTGKRKGYASKAVNTIASRGRIVLLHVLCTSLGTDASAVDGQEGLHSILGLLTPDEQYDQLDQSSPERCSETLTTACRYTDMIFQA